VAHSAPKTPANAMFAGVSKNQKRFYSAHLPILRYFQKRKVSYYLSEYGAYHGKNNCRKNL